MQVARMVGAPGKVCLILCAYISLFGRLSYAEESRLPGISEPDGASQQLAEFKRRWTGTESIETTSFGVPVSSVTASLTAGPQGPLLLQDTVFIDTISHLVRERIPERVVHAKGYGAFGYFECTHDISGYTKAVTFSSIGKRTDIVVRMSDALGENGAADTIRGFRGFAIKFYTENGIWDLVAINTPVLSIRDPLLFASNVHSQRRNPVTHLRDPNMQWDFLTLRPETVHQVLMINSDLGLNDGFRHMNAFGVNTFKLVNAEGQGVWCKFHLLTDQGVRNLSAARAANLSATDPDYSGRDLYNAIHRGDYPSWTFYIQVMTFEQAKHLPWNPFDDTKIWPEDEFPLIPAGRIVLNRNPTNNFADVEQAAYDPAHLIPGIEPSPDKTLQGRLLAYGDTQRYRVGPNVLQVPVNCPFSSPGVHNQQRDGPATYYNQVDAPNYYPNSYYEPKVYPEAKTSPFYVNGIADRYESGNEDNFRQASAFYRSLDEAARDRLAAAVVTTLGRAEQFIQERAIKSYFGPVDSGLAQKLRNALRRA